MEAMRTAGLRRCRSPSCWYAMPIARPVTPPLPPAPHDHPQTARELPAPLCVCIVVQVHWLFAAQVLFRSGPLKAAGVRPLSSHTFQFTERLTELGVAVCTVDDCLDGIGR